MLTSETNSWRWFRYFKKPDWIKAICIIEQEQCRWTYRFRLLKSTSGWISHKNTIANCSVPQMILIHIASLLLNQIAAMSSGGGVQPDLKWNGDALVCWFKQQTSRLRGHIQVLLPTNTFEASFGIKLSIWWRLIIWAHCRWTSRHGKLLPNCMTSPEDARPLGPRPTPERLVSFLLGSTIAEKRGYTVKPYHLHKLTTDLFRNLFAFMPCAFFVRGGH